MSKIGAFDVFFFFFFLFLSHVAKPLNLRLDLSALR